MNEWKNEWMNEYLLWCDILYCQPFPTQTWLLRREVACKYRVT
jgi:hypothetical protein